MLIGSTFDHFMTAYWNEMCDFYYEKIEDAVMDYIEKEGYNSAIRLKGEVVNLISSGYFKKYEEYGEEFSRATSILAI